MTQEQKEKQPITELLDLLKESEEDVRCGKLAPVEESFEALRDRLLHMREA